MIGRRGVMAAGAALLAAGTERARAAPADDTLRVTWIDALDDLDPYATPLRTGMMLAHDVHDGLIHRDPDTLQLLPLLARSWRLSPDRLAIDLTLATGVRFHDGSPFGPDDVVATVDRARRSDVAVPSNYAWLAGAEATGDGVRLHLAHPFAPALDYLAMVLPIMSASGASAVGTGPYAASLDPDGTIRLLRNEGYSVGPRPRAAIARVAIRQRPGDTDGAFDDLTSGRADWMWQLTPTEFAAAAVATTWQAIRAESMRVAYLQFDAAGLTDPDGPLTRVAVRRAIVRAIDRATVATIAGATRVAAVPCYPSQFGCAGSTAGLAPFDRAAAIAELAAAGYPRGFDIDLVTYLRPEIVGAVVAFLGEAGVRARVERLPTGEAMARLAAGHAPLFLGSWGSWSINDVSAFLPAFFGGGPLDDVRREDLAALVRQGDEAAQADPRRAAYGRAIELIGRDALFLPLYDDGATYGVSRRLSFRAAADELPRFHRMTWR